MSNDKYSIWKAFEKMRRLWLNRRYKKHNSVMYIEYTLFTRVQTLKVYWPVYRQVFLVFPFYCALKRNNQTVFLEKKKHMNQTLNLERQVSYTTGQFNKFINNQYICRILSLPRKLYGLWTQCSPVIARLKFSLPYFFLVQNKNRNN